MMQPQKRNRPQKRSRERLFSRVFSSILIGVFTISCASSSKRGIGGGEFKLLAYEEVTLTNGLKVLFVPDERLPYINYTLLVGSGSADDQAQ